jgi:adenylate cyclase
MDNLRAGVERVKRHDPIQWWLLLGALITIGANLLAVFTTSRTFGAMGGISDFAIAVRQHDERLTAYYNPLAFIGATCAIAGYIWPIVTHFRRVGAEASIVVQRRVVSTPLAVATIGLTPWIVACVAFPVATYVSFGRWSPELMSQQVLSPLVSGFLAATTTYLLLDWLVRARVAPRVFPGGRLRQAPGTLALGVRGRLLIFLLAVAFTPLFTMLGLVRAAVSRLEAGVPASMVVPVLAHASSVTFAVYVLLGVGLTLILARILTRPLVQVAGALRRVQSGDLDVDVRVGSSDEIGVLADGVNAMVAALRDKEHILQTFGRVVEPSVRDQLLAGELRLGGELRTASVLFCDLRGFTAMAERTPAADVVVTLNAFFTVMTDWVRECGGFVDKFIGDAVLVVFGLFESDTHAAQTESAAAALRCGVGVRERLAALNARRAAAGQPPLVVAVGIHTGEVLAGRIGAEDRHEYTVIGDTVNVAARLQQFAKELGHSLLVSETTYELARARGVAAPVTMQDSISLRGRSEPVRVFGVA